MACAPRIGASPGRPRQVPDPKVNSPASPHARSFATRTGGQVRFRRTASSGTPRHFVGRFGRNRIFPVRRSTSPGAPTPIAATERPHSDSAASMSRAILSVTCAAPCAASVAIGLRTEHRSEHIGGEHRDLRPARIDPRVNRPAQVSDSIISDWPNLYLFVNSCKHFTIWP